MGGVLVGNVGHYYNRISVAVVTLTESIHLGDKVHFLGRTTDFLQEVTSIQVEHQSIEEAGPGQEVAMKVSQRVRRGDKVFKLFDDD